MKKLINNIALLCAVALMRDTSAPTTIDVSGLAGPLCTVEVPDDATITDVRNAIQESTGIPAESQRLLQDTMRLAADTTLDTLVVPGADRLSLTLVVQKTSEQHLAAAVEKVGKHVSYFHPTSFRVFNDQYKSDQFCGVSFDPELPEEQRDAFVEKFAEVLGELPTTPEFTMERYETIRTQIEAWGGGGNYINFIHNGFGVTVNKIDKLIVLRNKYNEGSPLVSISINDIVGADFLYILESLDSIVGAMPPL